MRHWGMLLLLGILGCQPAVAVPPVEPKVAPPQTTQATPDKSQTTPDKPPTTIAAPAPSDAPRLTNSAVADLGTRKTGVDWPIFLGPTRDSKSPEQGIRTNWNEQPLKILWQRKLGEGYGIGSISQGRYLQADRDGNQARLVCLNAETGKEIWKFAYPTDYVDMYGYDGGPRCSPVIDGERVYMYGVEGMLHCVSLASGEVLWKVDTVKDFGVVQNFFGVGSTPVVEGQLLIVMVGGSPADSQGLPLDRVAGNGSAIVAFDKLTGKVVYKISDELASYASLQLATMHERRFCFAFCRGGLLAFEPSSGKIDFHYPWRAKVIESVNASMPVVSSDEVFISETYGPGSSLLKVIPGDYKVVWADDLRKRDKAMQTHWNTPVLVDGYLYGSSGRHTENAELRCIEWQTGKVMWSEPRLTRTSLLLIDGHFLCLGEYGQLQLLKVNPKKYELVAEVLLKEKPIGPVLQEDPPAPLLKYPAWAAPIVSHGLLYVRGADRVVCLELIPAK